MRNEAWGERKIKALKRLTEDRAPNHELVLAVTANSVLFQIGTLNFTSKYRGLIGLEADDQAVDEDYLQKWRFFKTHPTTGPEWDDVSGKNEEALLKKGEKLTNVNGHLWQCLSDGIEKLERLEMLPDGWSAADMEDEDVSIYQHNSALIKSFTKISTMYYKDFDDGDSSNKGGRDDSYIVVMYGALSYVGRITTLTRLVKGNRTLRLALVNFFQQYNPVDRGWGLVYRAREYRVDETWEAQQEIELADQPAAKRRRSMVTVSDANADGEDKKQKEALKKRMAQEQWPDGQHYPVLLSSIHFPVTRFDSPHLKQAKPKKQGEAGYIFKAMYFSSSNHLSKVM
jgi:hypothetical protein